MAVGFLVEILEDVVGVGDLFCFLVVRFIVDLPKGFRAVFVVGDECLESLKV